MSIINRFERIDAAIARSLPQWPVSLVMLVCIVGSLGLLAILILVFP